MKMYYNIVYARKEGYMNKENIVYSDDIKLAIYLKINQLKRDNLSSLTYNHLLKVLFHCVWDRKKPTSIHEAVNDIMRLNANDIVISLHTLAMIEGSTMGVEKIDEILGGDL